MCITHCKFPPSFPVRSDIVMMLSGSTIGIVTYYSKSYKSNSAIFLNGCINFNKILAVAYYGFEMPTTIYRSFQHLIWNYYSHIKNGGFTHEQFINGNSYMEKGCEKIEL